MIIGLMGMSRHGKDTCGAVYIENGYERYAFGDAVKREYGKETGLTMDEINGVDKEKHRVGVIALAEGKRAIDPFYWVNIVKTEIITKQTEGKNIIITDIRRMPEIKFMDTLKEVFGKDQVKLYEVVKPKANGGVFDNDKITTEALLWAHFNSSVDGVIYNSETQTDLEVMIQSIIDSYGE